MTPDKPVITIKNLKVNDTLSEETTCYSATIYVDGVKFGETGNDGHGGCDRILSCAPGVTRADFDKLDERIAATYPRIVHDGTDLGPCNLEWLVSGLIEDAQWAKDFRRAAKGKVLMITPGEKGVSSLKVKPPHTLAQYIAHARTRWPGSTILNDLPEDEAVKLFRENVTVR